MWQLKANNESDNFVTESYNDFLSSDNYNNIVADKKCDNDICFRNKTSLAHIRMDSDKNYDPTTLWYQGYQFVGINFSTNDKYIDTISDSLFGFAVK